MNKAFSLTLIAAGILLLIYGVHAANSDGSEFYLSFSDSPPDKIIWLLFGGVIISAIGAGLLLRGPKSGSSDY